MWLQENPPIDMPKHVATLKARGASIQEAIKDGVIAEVRLVLGQLL